MEKHVPTKQTCQRLAELVELDTEFYWHDTKDEVVDVYMQTPAPLLSELYRAMYTVSGEPFRLFKSKKSVWVCHLGWTTRHSNITFSDESNPVEPVCKMLIYSIENDKIQPDEL